MEEKKRHSKDMLEGGGESFMRNVGGENHGGCRNGKIKTWRALPDLIGGRDIGTTNESIEV